MRIPVFTSAFHGFIAALLVGCGLFTPRLLHAQIQHGGTPYSFTHDVSGNTPIETMRSVDTDALMTQDQAERQSGQPMPPRFGTALDVSLGIDNAGRWTDLPNGDRLWRLRIASQGAHSINLIFDQYRLPPGGELFIYNEDRSTVLGAFTEANNKEHGRFSTLPVEGAVITLEYIEPAEHRGRTNLRVSKVIHAYRNIFAHGENGFGASADCEINVNCSQGNGWYDERRSVALVLLDDNTRHCTGALVNNEPLTLSPYFLSAFHCGDTDGSGSLSSTEIDDIETWLFWFNYEAPSCSNPSSEPGHDGMSGATFRAGNSASDFLLIELNNIPPYRYNTYYAGWSASNTASQSSIGIHHPHGDIKKIAVDNHLATEANWPGTPSNSHWRANFDEGTVEHGSSGSPLFDQNARIVGQLHGNLEFDLGDDYCDIPYGWYGKFSMSWDYTNNASTRLRDWLDPDNTGIQQLNGIEGPTPLQVTISGPTEVNEGQTATWTASISGGDGSYESITWYKMFTDTPHWEFVCIGTMACTTSFEDSNSQPDTGSLKFEVYDEGGRYFGDDVYSVSVIEYGGYYATSGSPAEQLPEAFTLQGNAPNPFREATSIRFALPEAVHVELVVYDVMGRAVATLVDRAMQPGFKQVLFDARGLASGTYLYRLRAGDFVQSKHMVVVK